MSPLAKRLIRIRCAVLKRLETSTADYHQRVYNNMDKLYKYNIIGNGTFDYKSLWTEDDRRVFGGSMGRDNDVGE